MLREENNKPVPKPMPRPIPMPRREYEYPEYERPDYDYPTMPNCPPMPDYPNNMNPCPYPDHDMHGDNEMDLEEMMRRNPALKRCVMDCVERHNNRYPCRPMPCYPPHNPCMPRPTPTPRPRRRPCRCNEYDAYDSYDHALDYSYGGQMETYDFSESKEENLLGDLNQIDIEKEEK